MESLNIVRTSSTSVYENLAAESVMLECLDGVSLFLWTNDNTVVIGKNQNAYAEVNVNALHAEGTILARRYSGGGAVYHDKNNLNFTFIADKNVYSLQRQFSVICRAVDAFGIKAELSGRNDIAVEGKKFSGNAFVNLKDRSLHHGTILIDTDKSKLGKLLTVDKSKLKTYGVRSVESRIVNLAELNPDITVSRLSDEIIKQAIFEYNINPIYREAKEICTRHVGCYNAHYSHLSDPEFVFGRKITMNNVRAARFDWGVVQVEYSLSGSFVSQLEVYSDSLDVGVIPRIKGYLLGKDITSALDGVPSKDIPYVRSVVQLICGNVG
ncbi:MAG: lipoate--protein ligase [Clostridia bacterium]|nr:lipoate--protein ligase [Clostridia bacterium]